MMFYKSGVYDGKECGNNIVNHTAIVVGYDLEDKVPHFIMLNSWGEDWGEKGIYRMKIDYYNSGGICKMADNNFML